jgi:hypothetical protein
MTQVLKLLIGRRDLRVRSGYSKFRKLLNLILKLILINTGFWQS